MVVYHLSRAEVTSRYVPNNLLLPYTTIIQVLEALGFRARLGLSKVQAGPSQRASRRLGLGSARPQEGPAGSARARKPGPAHQGTHTACISICYKRRIWQADTGSPLTTGR